MPSSFDLYLSPLARGGKEPPVGLYVASPPRRAARSRSADRLIFFLAFTGSAPLPPQYLQELLSELAKSYFGTAGTVTTAQKLVAEILNDYLLARNLRNAASGNQTLGVFTQVVLRGDRLFIAQSGPAHAFVIAAGTAQALHDVQLSGRGLGLGKTPGIRYSQTEVHPNDAIVLAVQPPTSWNSAIMQSIHRQGLESLRRYLLDHLEGETEAIFIRVSPGEGKLHCSPSAAVSAAPSATRSVAPSPAPSAAPSASRSLALLFTRLAPLFARFGSPWRGITSVSTKILLGVLSFLQRLLPDESLFTIPASLMFFVAIAVPLAVVTLASMTYFQRGRESQYQIYFTQAQETARQAEAETEPAKRNLAWQATLKILAQAERYRTTPASEALRTQAQDVLDKLDSIQRLNFRPAFTKRLGANLSITRMVASDNALYLLDQTEGKVLRATISNDSYSLDNTLGCEPGAYEGLPVGAIVAIALPPPNNESQAAIVGIDDERTLLYCIPKSAPIADSLTPPGTNWGKPHAMLIDSNDLYLLDSQSNAVWIYRELNTEEQPQYYFGTQPPPMADVIGMATYLGELYLLHKDGHLTKCVFSSLPESPTRCEDPANFSDTREGRSHTPSPLVEGALFSDILFTSPPASLYLLDAQQQAVYHFGMGLTLQQQYRASSALSSDEVTAFTVNHINRRIFLAFGNQVYFAQLP